MAVLELTVLGLGLGASRHKEAFRMEAFKFGLRVIDGKVVFHTKSDKVYSILSKAGQLIEHLLPASISRFILLHFWVVFESSAFDNLKQPHESVDRPVLPNLKAGRTYLMKDLAKELFHLREAPGDRILRQFFTSLTNYLFNDREEPTTFEEILVADPHTAASSGHSASTHRTTYATAFSKNGEQMKETKSELLERKRQHYHEAIGESTSKPKQAPRSEVIQEIAVKESLTMLEMISSGQ